MNPTEDQMDALSDEIRRLRAENAALREALQAILDSPELDSKYETQEHVRSALQGAKDD